MTLLCPKGHPSGPGQTACPLCGSIMVAPATPPAPGGPEPEQLHEFVLEPAGAIAEEAPPAAAWFAPTHDLAARTPAPAPTSPPPAAVVANPFCSACGSALAATAAFCSACGTPTAAPATATASAEIPVQYVMPAPAAMHVPTSAFAPPMPGYGPPPLGDRYQPPSGNDGLAIGSLVLGIFWLFGLGSIAAVVLGHLSLNKAGREGRAKGGLAQAGLVLGYLGIAGTLLLVATTIPAVRSQNHKAHLAIVTSDLRTAANEEEAFRTDHDTYADLPTLQAQGLRLSKGVTMSVVRATDMGFCLSATLAEVTYYYDSNRGLQTFPCG
jgi:hypothetical protein